MSMHIWYTSSNHAVVACPPYLTKRNASQQTLIVIPSLLHVKFIVDKCCSFQVTKVYSITNGDTSVGDSSEREMFRHRAIIVRNSTPSQSTGCLGEHLKYFKSHRWVNTCISKQDNVFTLLIRCWKRIFSFKSEWRFLFYF